MSEFAAETTGIAAFADTAAEMARRVQTAGAGVTADAGILGAVFGIIGGGFVAAYTDARGAHLRELDRLASTWDAMSTTAATTAVAYDATDADIVAGLGAAGSPGGSR
ncbi:hypothetical protein [Rhodococcus sp. SGAir0479]|uniref:hypothetical protein n=1 Tax=Rhodococcus sp. SGAir0479 TaxID=2567884 RepID=UPI0010CD3D38|nr:hypothetical protein [Rhodococcus sp. SGAir0479]QCQ92070.1 hypothetical protein E7742_13155 [Rhodococcus sp. SGAir0479]